MHIGLNRACIFEYPRMEELESFLTTCYTRKCSDAKKAFKILYMADECSIKANLKVKLKERILTNKNVAPLVQCASVHNHY